MSFNMSVASVLTEIVEKVLPPLRESRERVWSTGENGRSVLTDPGISMKVDLSLSHYTPDWTYERRETIHWLFCNHVSTFAAMEGDERWFDAIAIPLDVWKNTSNHDSCWRSDGVDSFLSKVYFDWCTKLNEQLKGDGFETIRPCDFHQFCHMGIGMAWKEVLIDHTADDREEGIGDYWRKIVKVERLEQ